MWVRGLSRCSPGHLPLVLIRRGVGGRVNAGRTYPPPCQGGTPNPTDGRRVGSRACPVATWHRGPGQKERASQNAANYNFCN